MYSINNQLLYIILLFSLNGTLGLMVHFVVAQEIMIQLQEMSDQTDCVYCTLYIEYVRS